MRTFAYLLNDETNPPQLWEVIGRNWPHPAELGSITLKKCTDPSVRVLVHPEEIWEVCTY